MQRTPRAHEEGAPFVWNYETCCDFEPKVTNTVNRHRRNRMSEHKSKLQSLEEIVVRLKDVENSYVAIVEKMATLLTQAEEAGQDSLKEKLGRLFTAASNNAKLMGELQHDAEIERNKLRQGAV
jgi:hypothetical protein